MITAGAFIIHRGDFLFQFGPDRSGERLGVVRVGGHIESGETPWACARREALEEASVHIQHVEPPATFRLLLDSPQVVPISWDQPEPAPLVVVVGPDGTPSSLLYLAVTEDPPMPAAESHGLMLLSPAMLEWLATGNHTLGDLVAREGRVIVRAPMAAAMLLLAGYHLRIFAKIVEEHPLIGNFKPPGL